METYSTTSTLHQLCWYKNHTECSSFPRTSQFLLLASILSSIPCPGSASGHGCGRGHPSVQILNLPEMP